MPSQRAAPKITVLADCSGSPINQRLRDLNIAFARADVAAILDFFADDIAWDIIGEREICGLAAARETLEAMSGVAVRELTIHSIISDGREGAVNGLIAAETGGAVAFCDVCRFDAGGKIGDLLDEIIYSRNQQGEI